MGAGALSGMWFGLFVGTIFAIFDPTGFNVLTVVSTVLVGAVFGAIWGYAGYRLTGGRRDFTSVSQVVAAKYEVICEHKHVHRGRELLAQMDPMKAAQEQVRRAQEEERARLAAQQRYAPPPSAEPGTSPASPPPQSGPPAAPSVPRADPTGPPADPPRD